MNKQSKELDENDLSQVAGGGPDFTPDVAEQIADLVRAYQRGDITERYLREQQDKLLNFYDIEHQDLHKYQRDHHIGQITKAYY